MTDDRTLRAIPRVAELIAKADALLITAGAGMGVDSGLPDYRGGKGLWGEYPPLAKLGISFEQLAQPHWFEEKPEMAWAFYGHRQELYRTTKPHAGFRMLLEWGRAMPAGYFAVTSNVDGHFQFAGVPGNRILEQHGNIHRYQCTVPCSSAIWIDDQTKLTIDMATLRATSALPRCPECGAIARPNEMMFDDLTYLPDVKRAQQDRYSKWLASVRGKRVVILEFGAGTAIDTIRRIGVKVTERSLTTLVRVNPDATEADEPAVPIRMTALEALTIIEAALPESFRQRCSDAVPEEPRWPIFEEGVERHPNGQFTSVCESLSTTKLRTVYSKAWNLTLSSGVTVWVERLDVQRNYLGAMSGMPGSGWDRIESDKAREFVRSHFHGPEPVVIPPKLYDATSESAIVPPLRFAAQISSWEPLGDGEGSWMNLIWFADIDDDKSIKAFVEEALAQVDWKVQAEGYSI